MPFIFQLVIIIVQKVYAVFAGEIFSIFYSASPFRFGSFIYDFYSSTSFVYRSVYVSLPASVLSGISKNFFKVVSSFAFIALFMYRCSRAFFQGYRKNFFKRFPPLLLSFYLCIAVRERFFKDSEKFFNRDGNNANLISHMLCNSYEA